MTSNKRLAFTINEQFNMDIKKALFEERYLIRFLSTPQLKD